jgi:uncharacterized protein (TIGR02598 family)
MAHNRRQAAFSLVEVVMALGIAAFCLVALLGLMPVGLKTVRDARGDALRAEVLKAMGNIAQQTDYSLLGNLAGKKYYFDINGLVVSSASADAIYEAVLSTGTVNVPSSSTSTALSGATSVTVAIRRSANTNSEATTHTLFISNNGN